MTVHHLCLTQLPRAAGAENAHCELTPSRTRHTPKIALSLEGGEGTGAEPVRERPAQHLPAVALQRSAALEGGLPSGQ